MARATQSSEGHSLKRRPQATEADSVAARPRAAYQLNRSPASLIVPAQKSAVEADDDGRVNLLGRVDHSLKRLDVPALEISHRVPTADGPLHQRADRLKRHERAPQGVDR